MRELVLWKPQAAWMARFERVGSVIARFSYTIYLTHILFLLLIMNFCFKISANCNMQETSYCAAPKYTLFAAFSRLDIKTFLLYCLSVIASLLFSYGVYWLFERRTDALKAYIRKCLT